MSDKEGIILAVRMWPDVEYRVVRRGHGRVDFLAYQEGQLVHRHRLHERAVGGCCWELKALCTQGWGEVIKP